MRTRREPYVNETELAALADGSLAPDRRAEIEKLLASSPALEELLAEQERAVSAVRRATAGVEAPVQLRARVEAERHRRRARRRAWPALAFGISAAAAVAFVLALALPGGTGGPTLADAADLGVLPAAAGAPRAQPGTKVLLEERVDGVAFPRWETDFAWRATGARHDRLGDREAATVFYEKNGRRIAYTIVSGRPLDMSGQAHVVRRKGVTLRVVERGNRVVVVWLRLGHACVLSGAGVDRDVLVRLASWSDKGVVPF